MSDPRQLLGPEVAAAFYGRFPDLREGQRATIEPILLGRNVVLCAGTGTGKTEAVMAPLMARYWRAAARNDWIILLYIAPTKALVNDVERRLVGPLASLGLTIGVRHGDRDDLAAGRRVHVLVTTPESLEVLLFRKDDRLGEVRAVVIDEVHLLYNTQRGLQLAFLLRRLRGLRGDVLQDAALSATMTAPDGVQTFLFGRRSEAECVSCGSRRPIDAHIRVVSCEGELAQVLERVTDGPRAKLLLFTDSRRECERLAGVASSLACRGVDICAHYSSLSAETRLATERRFAASPKALCVATSTLELGIDIGDIDAVLLWGAPGSVASFLQRIGRGNRRSHKTNVICLVPDTADSPVRETIKYLALLDAARAGQLPRQEPFRLYGAVAQQCLAIIASEAGAYLRTRDLTELLSSQGHIDGPVVERVLAELHEHGFLQPHGFKNRYGADEKLHELVQHRMIYGNFPANSSVVEVRHSGRVLGSVPGINLLRIHARNVVRFGGRCWRVTKATADGYQVEPTKPTKGAMDFIYAGKGPGLSPFMCDRMWALLHDADASLNDVQPPMRQTIDVLCRRVRDTSALDRIPYVASPLGHRYYTFAGGIVNRAICAFVGASGDAADDFSLLSRSEIDWGAIPKDPEGLYSFIDQTFVSSSEQSIYQRLLPADLQLAELREHWLRDGAIADVLSQLHHSRPVEVAADLFQSF